jgi:pilus assembly protein Flp/PilA
MHIEPRIFLTTPSAYLKVLSSPLVVAVARQASVNLLPLRLPLHGFFFMFQGEEMLKSLTRWTNEFIKREDGPTAVEYAVMLALIIVVCVVAITALGTNANKTFTNVSNKLANVGS